MTRAAKMRLPVGMLGHTDRTAPSPAFRTTLPLQDTKNRGSSVAL